MAVKTITYDDKQYLNQNADIPATNKVQDTDMNEIKAVVNNNANELINLQAVELYNNSQGSNGNITLSDSVINYSYIEIFFRNNDDLYSSNKFENINTKELCLISTAIDISTTTPRIKTSSYSVNDNIISFIGTADWNLKANAGTVSGDVSNNIIYITKIIGYK